MAVVWDSITKGSEAVISTDGLSINSIGSSYFSAVKANKTVDKGKLYAEFLFEKNLYNAAGVCDVNFNPITFNTGTLTPTTYIVGYEPYRGFKQDVNGYSQAFGVADTTNNITIGLAIDFDNKSMMVYKNGDLLGTASFSHLTAPYTIYAYNYGDSVIDARFDGTDLQYPVPYNYKAFGSNEMKKTLVGSNGGYRKYTGTSWEIVSVSEPTEEDYKINGMDDVSTVPETAWSQLSGQVELCFYIIYDEPITEVSFNIETEPFTLSDEWEGQTIKILEYTDNPSQVDSLIKVELNKAFTLKDRWENKTIKILEYTDNPIQSESVVTIETDPFSLYDEFGDEVDVLYYTDDLNKTSATLEITANYSPLDAIEGDFEVVTWTNEKGNIDEGDVVSRTLAINALPVGQLIVNPNKFANFGEIQTLTATLAQDNIQVGTVRFMLSFDSGVTWNAFFKENWTQLNIQDSKKIKDVGMTVSTFNSLSTSAISEKVNSDTMIAYYLDEDIRKEESDKISQVKTISQSPIYDVKINDLAFYLLNTTATINLTFGGSKLRGVLDDADKGKVKYRILLNDTPYYPISGEFTSLIQSPFDINIVIDDRRVNFGVENTLKVEFQDYWGQTDSWSSTFIGSHSGLVFTDEQGRFYTTGFGEVLKYLDFGEIIAGQTTLDQKVILKNTIGYDVKNVELVVIQPNLSGVKVEISEKQSPFIALERLAYSDILAVDEEIEFFVRITTLLTAQETPSGRFGMNVNADRVV